MRKDRLPCELGLSRETLSAWRDRLLPEMDAHSIALHVADCAACQHKLAQFTQIAVALQQQPAPDLRAQTWRGLQARLSQKERPFMRISRAVTISGIGATALLLVMIVVFVTILNQRPHGNTGPVDSSTATATATIIDTPVATTCDSALPGAGPASAGSNFSDLPLPVHSVSTAPSQTGGGGDGQFTLYDLQMCTSNSSPSAINDFFAGLTPTVWVTSSTFPSDGSFQSACATSPDCWATNDARYVTLSEPITDLGGGVERYHLTLATPPPAPDCSGISSNFPTGYYYQLPSTGYTSTKVFDGIPLPPLSRIGHDDASGGARGYNVCSAGTAASVTSFMTTQLGNLGWTFAGNGVWMKSGYSLMVYITAANDWLIYWHDPDFSA